MKKIAISAFIVLITISLNAQQYFTKNGKINFDATSATSPEKIMAISHVATCVLDAKSGALQFSILVKSFEFEKKLMQEHFNENFLESNKFPKMEFKGKIVNMAQIKLLTDGEYNAIVSGEITIHGEKKPLETKGKIIVKGGKIMATSTFELKLEDFKITIPKIASEKVSKKAKISVECALEILKK